MNRKTFLHFSIVFGAVYFFSQNGLAALPNLTLDFLLKEKVKLTPAGMAYFQAVVLLAWVIKPLWGFISDSFPLFGYRRRSYLMLTSALAAFCWFSLAGIQNYSVTNLLVLLTICYMAYAFQDVVTDALMVEAGKPADLTGKFQSIQWSCVYVAMILTAAAGGKISDLTRSGQLTHQKVFLATAAFPIVTMIVVHFFADEKKKKGGGVRGPRLKNALAKRDIWLVALFLFLWNFSPSVGAPFFYYSVDTLKFSGSFLGVMQAVASGSALAGSLLYARYAEKFSMRKVIIFLVFAGVAMLLSYLIYFVPSVISHTRFLKVFAIVTKIPFGIADSIIFLTLLNLAAKTSPQDAGGTVFALLMSFYNLGLTGSSVLGGWLYPIFGLKILIVVSAVTSLVVLLILPYLAIDDKLTAFERGIKKFQGRLFASPKEGRA